MFFGGPRRSMASFTYLTRYYYNYQIHGFLVSISIAAVVERDNDTVNKQRRGSEDALPDDPSVI